MWARHGIQGLCPGSRDKHPMTYLVRAPFILNISSRDMKHPELEDRKDEQIVVLGVLRE